MKIGFVLAILILVCGASLGYDLDIHSMVVGDKALELFETNPLTSRADGDVDNAWISPNGKWVAYQTVVGDNRRLSIISSDGGRPITLINPAGPVLPAEKTPVGYKEEWSVSLWLPTFSYGSPWSPDSRFLAVSAFRGLKKIQKDSANATGGSSNDGDKDSISETWMLVFDIHGKLVNSFQLQDMQFADEAFWSQNFQFAAACCSYSETGVSSEYSILLFTPSNGSVKTVLKRPDEGFRLFGWSGGGTSILYSSKPNELKEIQTDGSEGRTVVIPSLWPRVSPNAKLRVTCAPASVSVERLGTGEKTDLFKRDKVYFRGWTPGSQFFFCQRDTDLQDFAKLRKTTASETWLAVAEGHKLNHLCLTSHSDGILSSFTASLDTLRIAYVCENRLYVAALQWREPTAWEKLVVGMSLGEDDAKTILLERADRIAGAISSILDDADDEKLPSADDVRKDIVDRLDDEDKPGVFLRPGKQSDAFTYDPPEKVDDAEKTVVGYLDAGYAWKVNIYADGHAELVDKK